MAKYEKEFLMESEQNIIDKLRQMKVEKENLLDLLEWAEQEIRLRQLATGALWEKQEAMLVDLHQLVILRSQLT